MFGYVDGKKSEEIWLSKKNYGKSNSVTSEMVNAWKRTSLPTLLSSYDLKDIYNTDEFGLFYKCMKSKTWKIKQSLHNLHGSSKCWWE